MGYFQVRYDSRIVNYNRRGFIRMATDCKLENNLRVKSHSCKQHLTHESVVKGCSTDVWKISDFQECNLPPLDTCVKHSLCVNKPVFRRMITFFGGKVEASLRKGVYKILPICFLCLKARHLAFNLL